MSQGTEKSVIGRIYGSGRGRAFSQKDFADLGARKAIAMALMRLADRAIIRRVIRGIYDYPRQSKLLGKEMGPDIHQVAQALARKFGWRIQPSGATALNLIGLSTQVPGRYTYQSDGPHRTYPIGKTPLSFQKLALKEAGFRHEASSVIVQALKALGQAHITDETITIIRKWLPTGKRSDVLKDTRRVTGWVYEAIQRICAGESNG